MRIAFYAPLKPPDHPVPSGDRTMARLLMRAITLAGHDLVLVSRFRSFIPDPSPEAWSRLAAAAAADRERIQADWQQKGKPDLWLTYHPYYKSPDMIGPELTRDCGIPYATAEASLSARRNAGAWQACQALVRAAVAQAAANFTFTARDAAGLRDAVAAAILDPLPPFIDAAPFLAAPVCDRPDRLVAVAMMRRGDKLDSYAMLASALGLIQDLPWTLTVVGDGDARDAVMAYFSVLPPQRVDWRGLLTPDRIAEVLAEGGIYVWPGCGEAYGLSYLEAQAAGLPVIAQSTAGVPEVVAAGRSGLLTPAADIPAYAAAMRRAIADAALRRAMAAAARDLVAARHTLEAAAASLDKVFRRVAGGDDGR